jgi:hypothetical protein
MPWIYFKIYFTLYLYTFEYIMIILWHRKHAIFTYIFWKILLVICYINFKAMLLKETFVRSSKFKKIKNKMLMYCLIHSLFSVFDPLNRLKSLCLTKKYWMLFPCSVSQLWVLRVPEWTAQVVYLLRTLGLSLKMRNLGMSHHHSPLLKVRICHSELCIATWTPKGFLGNGSINTFTVAHSLGFPLLRNPSGVYVTVC